MGNLKEKVAYLQGLVRGLDIKDSSPEGKLLVNIVDVLDSVAEEVQCVSGSQQDLENYVETIDQDLTDLEEDFYESDIDDDDFVEVECPNCHEVVSFESELLDEDEELEVTCPNCGDVVYNNILDFDDLEDDDVDIVDTRRTSHPGI